MKEEETNQTTFGWHEANRRTDSLPFSVKGREIHSLVGSTIERAMAYAADYLPTHMRETSILLTKLEEAHMWLGKACKEVSRGESTKEDTEKYTYETRS